MSRLAVVADLCRRIDVAIANGMPLVDAYRAATLLLPDEDDR